MAAMSEPDHPAVERVRAALQAARHPHAPRWLPQGAHTAADAAAQLGVPVGAIAKSVVMRAGDGAVLCITAGDRRVAPQRLPEALGPVGRADAEAVRRHTGFAIGGVSPLGLAPADGLAAPALLMDESLWRFDTVWAAAGHPFAVFAATPDALQALTGARVWPLTDEPT
jgi:prolyl-tRNA editing enzyme YbaK/EbsC (Cys-tRNA(Pro) deacylase)